MRGMEIIPVVDVRHGVAVRATGGERASYQPIETPLAQGSDPIAVAAGYRALFPFPTLYVADLDGIEGRGADAALQHRLAESWPGEVWIDDGSSEAASGAWTAVIGSESIVSHAPHLPDAGGHWVLSLDFRDDAFLGPPAILEQPELWPDRVIVMTLARVGSVKGPDPARVAAIAARAPRARIYAAGGIRNLADLAALRKAGAAGALVATALHRGTIKAGELRAIAGL
jgi:phosphoribosylformimino-5-aminoimidazole carboxamide ribotide isomerase